MGKSLVIVESPAKAKTINKYLGKDFVVKSSVGHVRDLPTKVASAPVDPKERARKAAETRKLSPEAKIKHKAKAAKDALFKRMGLNPEKDWQARYEVLPGKEKVIKELKSHAKNADQIFLATDLDREGEAIAWHLREVIGGEDDKYQRVVFNEITKKAIQEAFAQPSHLDMNYVNAQQTRRFLDRVVGFMVSPLLWKKVSRGLSAGRVQSVAVKLIVEREREIRAFIPDEYWTLWANTNTAKSEALRLEVRRYQNEKYRPQNKQQSDDLQAILKQHPFIVDSCESKPSKSRPSAPYITSTLQQAASTRLGFNVKKTMMLAQRLYEAGYITYMRTDSTMLSADAIGMCRDYIQENYGDKYLPENPKLYSNKEGAQEAHEAIRPTNARTVEKHLKGVDQDAIKLYNLIWRQFVACQMTDAIYDVTSLVVKAGEFKLAAKGRVVKFDGWTKVQPPKSKNDDDVLLPEVKVGETLSLESLDPKQHFTKPSPRYSEAALVKELEKRGIGRPSTYASIISTIQDRGYVVIKSRRFYATKIGEIVSDRLGESFNNLMDYSFTAKMEESLDTIANGNQPWKNTLDNFYQDLKARLEKAEQPVEEGGMDNVKSVEMDMICPQCNTNKMMIRNSSMGTFLGCSGFSLPPKERCKHTMNLISGDEIEAVDKDEEAESRNLLLKKRCPVCESAMDSFLIDEERKLHVCGNSPTCKGYLIEEGSFKIKGYDGPIIDCDKCGSEMQLKVGRFGKYFGCTNEECKNTRKLLRNGEPAPPKADPIPMPHLKCLKVDDHYILRDGASGIFLAASQFPKNRETRAPLVEELLTVKEQLDPKHAYMVTAPVADPDGNKAMFRFSRKAKEQYVTSEKDGKATGWSAHYVDGRWQETQKKKAAKKKKA
ncbi:type I DNA topoisomerase [Aliikangiella coralliicola]|uniref:DNA topoisomerase 1 n=1 Tax=Aliikangiella coralliicola TaxID=2592383 RepID=A0A545TWM0_9GAMM|nr:type I DNA topoisomerase [Aliikangiella coralliicola]TQV81571.1 type I DNA topoisomerase [Aliikangiella coralliicola]